MFKVQGETDPALAFRSFPIEKEEKSRKMKLEAKCGIAFLQNDRQMEVTKK